MPRCTCEICDPEGKLSRPFKRDKWDVLLALLILVVVIAAILATYR